MEAFCNDVFEHKNGFSTLYLSAEAAECVYLFSIFSNWEEAYSQCFTTLTEAQLNAIGECLSRKITGDIMLKTTRIPFLIISDKEYHVHAFQNWVNAYATIVMPCVRIIEESDDYDDDDEEALLVRLSENYSKGFSTFYKTCRCDTMERVEESCDLSSLTINEVESLDSRIEHHQKHKNRENNLKQLLRAFRITELAFWLMLYHFVHLPTDMFESFLTELTSDHKILRKCTIQAIRNWHDEPTLPRKIEYSTICSRCIDRGLEKVCKHRRGELPHCHDETLPEMFAEGEMDVQIMVSIITYRQ